MSEILTDRPSAKAGPRWFNYSVTLYALGYSPNPALQGALRDKAAQRP